MRQLRQIILTMLRVSYEFGVSKPQNEPVSRQGHINVAEAVARRDGESARRAMAEMLEQNRMLVAEYWDDSHDEDDNVRHTKSARLRLRPGRDGSNRSSRRSASRNR